MEKKTNKTTRLKEWLESLSFRNYSKKEYQIIQECKISRFTLWRWKCGKTEPGYLAQQKINEIAGQKIYDV